MSEVTKKALEQSLKNLLLKKPLTKITINDITEDCGINRMTFYYHFKDIYDLVEWSCLEGVIDEQSTGITVRDEDKEFIARIYSYVFIGIMLDWIKGDMKEDPRLIIDKLALLIKDSVSDALNRFKL
ncbi:MAG: TetR family transcriptional regulator C-terminal domain-containing protein [[Eubacterium] siraeum]|nr:TetR family transcriptional regulator C-terminal domain-containing protein [[Eubacterium] siraeum]